MFFSGYSHNFTLLQSFLNISMISQFDYDLIV